MKPATQETALAVKIIGEKLTAPAFTLKEAAKFTGFVRDCILEDGGDNICGAIVYHPTKGVVAWVSPNCRVWHLESEKDLHKGGKIEFTKAQLIQNFNQLFV